MCIKIVLEKIRKKGFILITIQVIACWSGNSIADTLSDEKFFSEIKKYDRIYFFSQCTYDQTRRQVGNTKNMLLGFELNCLNINCDDYISWINGIVFNILDKKLKELGYTVVMFHNEPKIIWKKDINMDNVTKNSKEFYIEINVITDRINSEMCYSIFVSQYFTFQWLGNESYYGYNDIASSFQVVFGQGEVSYWKHKLELFAKTLLYKIK